MQFDQHIHDLLHDYDCVVVPGLGGFVTNYRPAQIDRRKHLFSPPSKAILFNKNLTRNDGLLAHYAAEQEGINYDLALQAVMEFAENILARIRSKENVVVEGIGVLSLDNEQNMRFRPEGSSNFLRSAYGLTTFYATPVNSADTDLTSPTPSQENATIASLETAPIAMRQAFESKITQRTTAVERKRRRVPIAAAFLLLPFLFYVFWIPMKTDVLETGTLQISHLNPFSRANYGIYQARTETAPLAELDFSIENEKVFSVASEDQSILELNFTEDNSIKSIPVNLGIDVAEPVSTFVSVEGRRQLRFHIIGGCFSNLRNAERLVQDLVENGFDAIILDQKNTLHRVCYASYATRAEAVDAMRDIQATENKKAWLLVK